MPAQKNSDKQLLLIAILIITVGAGWLLSVLEIVPRIDWVWTLALAVVGLLAFVLGGVNKATFVVGPFFLIASLLSVLRQTDQLSFDVEVPILVILLGVLLLIARSDRIPAPDWILDEPDK